MHTCVLIYKQHTWIYSRDTCSLWHTRLHMHDTMTHICNHIIIQCMRSCIVYIMFVGIFCTQPYIHSYISIHTCNCKFMRCIHKCVCILCTQPYHTFTHTYAIMHTYMQLHTYMLEYRRIYNMSCMYNLLYMHS